MRIGLTAGVLVVMAALMTAPAAAEANGPETFGPTPIIPINVFEGSKPTDTMFNVILWLTTAVLIGVTVVLLWFLVKYRYQPGRRSVFIHGNNKLETVWTLIPTIILAVIAVLSQDSWSKLKYEPDDDDNPLRIRVIAMQFGFYFQYPGPDGELGALDAARINAPIGAGRIREMIGVDPNDPAGVDDVILPSLVVPKNRTVIAEIVSIDVIHSFFLPHFRVKQDAVPGMVTLAWFTSNRTSGEVIGSNPEFPLTTPAGDVVTYAKPFDIVCAELCGAQHYTMRADLYVVSEAQFEQYIQAEYAARQEELEFGDFGY